MNGQVGNVQLMQKINRLKVLNYVRRNPGVSRPQIAAETGLSLSSLTNITSYLLEEGLLAEDGTEQVGRVGRKSTLLRFRAKAYGLICISINEGNIVLSYTDLEGKIIANIRLDTQSLAADRVIVLVREHVRSILCEYGRENILGISVCVSGLVLDGSRFILSASLKWHELDIKRILEKETNLPVFLENNTLVKAVWYFCCRERQEAENMLFVDLENGIGAMQYYQGAVSRALLGEVGHTTVEKDGELCFCGNRGCLEAMCSAERIVRLYEEKSGETGVNLRTVAERCAQADSAAEEAVIECAQYLGIGLANLVNLLNPSIVVINAGAFSECRIVLEKAAAEMKRRAYPALTKALTIREIAVGENETVCGAALNLCDRLFDLSFPGNPVQ